ncbi:MAG: hypothetical protein AB7P37_14315 [Ramlibacter sp.]
MTLQKFFKCLTLAAWALAILPARADRIADARFAAPVQRYGHFALGQPHEYARLLVTTDTGRNLAFDLPQDEVFEDLTPRIVSLVPAGPAEVLTIVSARGTGARLMLLGLAGDRLAVSAQSAPIGTPMRWLNVVGVADLDGDGEAEISAVLTPHIGGTLKVYRKRGQALQEVAALAGFSNHVNHTPELALSLPVAMGDGVRLLVPDVTRRQLRLVALVDGRLQEVGRCPLPSPVIGPVQWLAPAEVSVRLQTGVQRLALSRCR